MKITGVAPNLAKPTIPRTEVMAIMYIAGGLLMWPGAGDHDSRYLIAQRFRG